jgi:hypothetical protein
MMSTVCYGQSGETYLVVSLSKYQVSAVGMNQRCHLSDFDSYCTPYSIYPRVITHQGVILLLNFF